MRVTNWHSLGIPEIELTFTMHLLCARHCAKGCALVVTNVTMTLYTIKPDEIQKGCYEYLPKVPDLHVVDLGYEHGGLMPKPMSSATP